MNYTRNQYLEFIACSTDGGIYEENENNFFGHVFEYNKKLWCTVENISNVNASGILSNTQEGVIGYHWATRKAIGIVKSWLERKGKKLYKKNEHIAINIFNHITTNFPIDAVIIDEENPEELKETIRQIFLNLRPFDQGIEKYKRFHNNPLIIDMKFDSEAGDNSMTFAVINEFCISRNRESIFPVKSLMIFISTKYIDIMDNSLKAYNDMKCYHNLVSLYGLEKHLPKPYKIIKKNGYEYCEFSFIKENLQPILWINFSSGENYTDEISIKLRNEVTGKYLYAKLINSEDCRQERNPENDSMNIVCEYIISKGRIISIN